MATSRVALPVVHLSSSLFSGRASPRCTRARVEIVPFVFPITFPSGSLCYRENWNLVGSHAGVLGAFTSSRKNGGKESRRWRAVAEQLQTETEDGSEVAVPADNISIFFEVEGALAESSVAKLKSTLESTEGVTEVDVTAAPDGTATVKQSTALKMESHGTVVNTIISLAKKMNVQATGVASGLVEVLIKGGFKVQALNLGFDEDDEDDEDLYDYDVSSTPEDEEAGSVE